MGRTATRIGAGPSGKTGEAPAGKKVLSRQSQTDGIGKQGNWQKGNGRRRDAATDGVRLHWPRTLARKGSAALAPEHLSYTRLRQRSARLQLFVLDCSASMLEGNRLALCKGVLLKLLERAYQQRDQIALICFSGDSAELRISPRPAASNSARDNTLQWLQPIRAGGGTPLEKAARLTDRLLKQWREQHAARQHSVWLISDGRSDEWPVRPDNADLLQIVDCEQQRIRLGRCETLARHWQCDYLTLDQIIA